MKGKLNEERRRKKGARENEEIDPARQNEKGSNADGGRMGRDGEGWKASVHAQEFHT